VEPGEQISWSTLHNTIDIVTHEWRDTGERGGFKRLVRVEYVGVPFTPLPYCTFGDYDNSTATERSNHRVMREKFSWLVNVVGDHGSQMLGFLGKLENQNPDLIEEIEALERYPIADEQDESDLEMEMKWAAWCDLGRRDFAEDLSEALDEMFPEREHEIDISREDDDPESNHKDRHPLTLAIDELWFKGADAFNVNGGSGDMIEGGGNVHFFIDEWIEKAKREPEVKRYKWTDGLGNVHEQVNHGTVEMREMLRDLSTRCGVLKPNVDAASDLYVRRAIVGMWLSWNGTAAPRELVAQCTDAESCAVLADWIDERTPPSDEPTRQVEMLLDHENYSAENYRSVCLRCGCTGQAHPTDDCHIIEL
jgi:hypothetical protein